MTDNANNPPVFGARISAHLPGHDPSPSDVISNLARRYIEDARAGLYTITGAQTTMPSDDITLVSINNISPLPPTLRPLLDLDFDENPTSVVNKTLGNYRHIYDVVQTSGRSKNNRWIVKNQGFSTADLISIPSTTVAGHYDFVMRDHTEYGKSKHVFVERFSAPGSSYSMPLGMLDIESEEFSSYNSLNFRNLDVRRHLSSWLTERYSIGQMSYEDIAGISIFVPKNTIDGGSFHKIPRNSIYVPQSPSTDTTNGSTSSAGPSSHIVSHESPPENFKERSDNFWKQSQIPARGHQYHWINSSTQSTSGLQGFASIHENVAAQHPTVETDPSSDNYGKAVGTIPKTGSVTANNDHSHTYIVDENGDGITSTDDGHYHDVVSWKVSEICKTNCTTAITDCSFSLGTPSCECVTGSGGSGQSIKGDETWQ